MHHTFSIDVRFKLYKIMKNKFVYLKDFKEAVRDEAIRRNSIKSTLPIGLIDEAIEAHCNNNLRVNPISNIVWNKEGWLSRPSTANDTTTYESEEDAAVWEFTCYVRNSASRKMRGYTLI